MKAQTMQPLSAYPVDSQTLATLHEVDGWHGARGGGNLRSGSRILLGRRCELCTQKCALSRWLHFGNAWSPDQVVGVSVCWDFQEHEDELMELIESKLVEKEERLHPALTSDPGTDDLETHVLRSLSRVFGLLLDAVAKSKGEEHPEPESFFARMERSMLAADAEKALCRTVGDSQSLQLLWNHSLQVVAKGEMSEEASG